MGSGPDGPEDNQPNGKVVPSSNSNPEPPKYPRTYRGMPVLELNGSGEAGDKESFMTLMTEIVKMEDEGEKASSLTFMVKSDVDEVTMKAIIDAD